MITHQGLRLVAPVDTWVDLAAVLPRDELVVVGDAIVARNEELLPELRRRLQEAKGRRGVARAAEALELIRPSCWSPMESRARLIFADGGLPEPELNAEVHDAAHTWIATVDFVWRDQRVIVEYDGAVHDDMVQSRLDVVRRRQLRAEGWTVIEIGRDDVLRWPDQLVALIRSELEGRAA